MAGPSLIATLGANIQPFVQGLSEARSQARHHGEGIGSALGEGLKDKLIEFGSLAGIEEGARRTLEWAEHLDILSIRTGLSVEHLQALELVAKKSGTSVDGLGSMYERLGIAMAKAHKEGAGGETAAGLGRLGVSASAIEAGDMQAAMQQIANHLQRAGEITPQLEADMKLIGKNARENIPALKEMTEENMAYGRALAVSVEHMVSMKTVMDLLKDAWHGLVALPKMFFGTIFDGLVRIGELAKVSAFSVADAILGKGLVESFKERVHELQEERRKAERELSGGKATDPGYAESKKAEDTAAKKREHQEKELERLKHLTDEEKRKGEFAKMSNDQRAAALREEISLLDARSKKAFDDPIKKQEMLLDAQKKRNELERIEQTIERDADRDEERNARELSKGGADKKQKSAGMDLNALQRIGAYSSAPEVAALDYHRKNETHLAQIKKTLDHMARSGGLGSSSVSSNDDVAF